MRKENKGIENVKEKDVKETTVSGKKFEDLDDQEMEKYQGSGEDGINPEAITTILTLGTKKGYVCN